MTDITEGMVDAAFDYINQHIFRPLGQTDPKYARLITKHAIEIALSCPPPPPGAAEIEPKTQDGRRLENRVAALEGLVEKLSRDQPTRITDLAQQVQALTEMVQADIRSWNESVPEDPTKLPCGCLKEPTPPYPRMTWGQAIEHFKSMGIDAPTPPQPAAPRIDPEDREQQRIVSSTMIMDGIRIDFANKLAPQILEDLTAYLNGQDNG